MKKNNKISIPLTKLQKLKLNHKKLLIIIIILLAILAILLFIPKNKVDNNTTDNINNNSNNKENNTEIKNEETNNKDDELNVYDVKSNKRPYAVMIPNDSEAKKRQYGINKAYLTYEITVEGSITRLLALFKDVNVEKIGPVRSSRHYYLDYALENDAIYVHFGWSPQAESDISSLKINNLNGIYNPSNMFWRDKNYNSPNNAFTSTENIEKAANKKDYRTTSDSYELLNYSKNVTLENDPTMENANTVKIHYTSKTYVKYKYDETNKYYLRYNNENKHIDNLENEQVHVKNIIILKMSNIDISGDAKGRQNLNNLGSGDGYYITEGKSIKITWNKDKRTDKTILKNSNGEEIKVNDGNTFIQIQPSKQNLILE
ncbi:MAG: DUF3048 domain-containing protein [Bacilli bacterium]|nr:DUF3048 domain-containing protein [Bacilli bacterium]